MSRRNENTRPNPNAQPWNPAASQFEPFVVSAVDQRQTGQYQSQQPNPNAQPWDPAQQAMMMPPPSSWVTLEQAMAMQAAVAMSQLYQQPQSAMSQPWVPSWNGTPQQAMMPPPPSWVTSQSIGRGVALQPPVEPTMMMLPPPSWVTSQSIGRGAMLQPAILPMTMMTTIPPITIATMPPWNGTPLQAPQLYQQQQPQPQQRESKRPEPHSTRKGHMCCHYAHEGKCKNGDRCWYLHAPYPDISLACQFEYDCKVHDYRMRTIPTCTNCQRQAVAEVPVLLNDAALFSVNERFALRCFCTHCNNTWVAVQDKNNREEVRLTAHWISEWFRLKFQTSSHVLRALVLLDSDPKSLGARYVLESAITSNPFDGSGIGTWLALAIYFPESIKRKETLRGLSQGDPRNNATIPGIGNSCREYFLLAAGIRKQVFVKRYKITDLHFVGLVSEAHKNLAQVLYVGDIIHESGVNYVDVYYRVSLNDITLASLTTSLVDDNAEKTAWFVMRGILHGLAFLHMRGIVHGEVGPYTTRIRREDETAVPYLVGHGIPKTTSIMEDDIYAWAITFAWLVLGGNNQEIWWQKITQLSSTLLSLLVRCLAEDPAKRPTVLELLNNENLKINGTGEKAEKEVAEEKEMLSFLLGVPYDEASKESDRILLPLDHDALYTCVMQEHQKREAQKPAPAPLPTAPAATPSKNPHGLFAGSRDTKEEFPSLTVAATPQKK